MLSKSVKKKKPNNFKNIVIIFISRTKKINTTDKKTTKLTLCMSSRTISDIDVNYKVTCMLLHRANGDDTIVCWHFAREY